MPHRAEPTQLPVQQLEGSQQIGNEDDQSALRQQVGKLPHGNLKGSAPRHRRLLQLGQQPPKMTWPIPRRDVLFEFFTKSRQPNCVPLLHQKTGERRGQRRGILRLGVAGGPKLHGSAVIDHQLTSQIRFILKLFDVGPVTPSQHLPINVPRIIPLHVSSILTELD